MHLAASNGHVHVLSYLLTHHDTDTAQAMATSTDRWGNTPLADAKREKHSNCEAVLLAL